MDEGLIQIHAMAARIACLRMTEQHLKALRDSVEYAACLPARSQWDRKAAAHAEIFGLLANLADDPVLAPVLSDGAGSVHHLMLTVGRGADGIIAGSRQRLLAHLRAGNAEGAALEMEKHLRALHYMWRLTRRSA
jgi:GntR family transcriptional regulator, transcriptional repressor for pyruvate dehydrogenase complex